jgi:two-component system phosphate regulon sensor histidine kinase PhoR
MFHSLRWRIAIPFILLISLAAISMGVYLSEFARQTYTQNLERELLAEARLISDSLSQIMFDETPRQNINRMANNWSELLDKRVTIISGDGSVLGESDQDLNQMDNHIDRPEIQQALSQGEGSSTRFSRTLEQRMMYVASPVLIDGEIAGYARLAIPLDQIESDITQIRRTLLSIVVISIILTVILAIWMGDRITKPIRKLTSFAGSISGDDPKNNDETGKLDEIEQLTRSINLMTLQLQSQIKELEIERGRIGVVLGEMTDGVIIVDDQGRIQLINPAIERMFRVSSEFVQGRSLIEALRHHQLNELWRESHRSGEARSASLEINNPHLFLQIVATPLGHVLPGSTLLLFQDITQIQQLETVRQDFISNISHELRTPLASLKALTETLQEGALDDPPAAHRFLERMQTEVDSLSLMVSELLELSRIESGRVPLHITTVQPCEILSQAVDRLRLQAERSRLSLSTKCSDDIPDISADAKRLEQVLVNLLHNAIKFTPEGGAIEARAQDRENRVIFSIEDTGVGIPSEDLLRIFERFYKSDRSRSSTGTGLGLAIARHLVEAHGGNIWVESAEGEGSIFSFSIPIANP